MTTTAALSVALSTFQPLPLMAQDANKAVCAQNPDLCPPRQKRGEGAQKRKEQEQAKERRKEERPAARAAQEEEGAAARARRANREQVEEGGQARRPAAEQDAPARGDKARARARDSEDGAARAQAEGNAADDTRLLQEGNGQGDAARPAKRARPAEEERPADRERAGDRARAAEEAALPGMPSAPATSARPPVPKAGKPRPARPRRTVTARMPRSCAAGCRGEAPAKDRQARGDRDGGAAADEEGGRNAEARGDGQARDAEGRDAERPRNRDAEGRDADRERNRNAEDRTRPADAQARDGQGRQQAGDEARRARQQQPEREEARKSLARILESEDQGEESAAAAAASAEDASEAAREARRQANRAERITEENSRSSNEEFRTLLNGNRDKKNDDDDDEGGLSNFEKFGLLALGGLAVGTLLNNNRGEVVSNSGDRVVVQRSDGTYSVLKDDDTLLRRPGSEVVTQSFDDGSTRSVVTRADGTQIVTIRDASGRVLRRTAVDGQGREVMLIDDLESYQAVDVSRLPEPAPVYSFVQTRDQRDLRQALEQTRTRDLDRTYSLRQIREYREVRALAPAIDVDQITFDTGSAAIDPDEAEKLASLGQTIADMIAERPEEVFLIEGHTDAVGDAASNLALSDRRAESVALALTEYFDVPPENMVVQGYGEEDLRVDSDGPEQRNRRVAVRLITPLMQTASN
ncbi:OmpA family protein [Cereibacter sphaeroides]|nr:OmpA family protein [Cereibacter sphaeroides]